MSKQTFFDAPSQFLEARFCIFFLPNLLITKLIECDVLIFFLAGRLPLLFVRKYQKLSQFSKFDQKSLSKWSLIDPLRYT